MNFKQHKIWWLPLFISLTLLSGGCSSHYSEDDLNPKEDGISLILNISTNDISAFGTRVVEDPDYFEQATLDTEKINSLRIIVVDIQPGSKTENQVIHNYYTGNLSYARFSLAGIRFDNLNFSSKYRIYLIANEKALPEEICNKFNDAALPAGSVYPKDGSAENLLEDIVVSNMANISSGSALINNESSYLIGGGSVKPIPMTEIFELTTDPRPDTNAEEIKYEMERNFFITRAASKFSFRILKSADYIEDPDHPAIKQIKIGGLGNQEYLFPNATVYEPEKYKPSSNEFEGREIIEFSVPLESISDLDYTFTLPDNGIRIAELEDTGNLFAPSVYFAECTRNIGRKLTCSISFDGNNFLDAVYLPNLPEGLPRNTHAIVYITIGNQGIVNIAVKTWRIIYFEYEY